MGRGRPPTRIDPTSSPIAAFGDTLRSQRLQQGLTMQEVARRANCSMSMLGEYERAERIPRDCEFVRGLARVLQISPDQLVDLWNRAVTVQAHAGMRPVMSLLGSGIGRSRPDPPTAAAAVSASFDASAVIGAGAATRVQGGRALGWIQRNPRIMRPVVLVVWTALAVMGTLELSD